jgi:hypothetical protein
MDSASGRGHDEHASDASIAGAGGDATTARLSLPNLLVPIDLREAAPTAPSLFALSQSRRVARSAGATVYAIALAEGELPVETVARLGQAGADKVLVCEGAGLNAPPLDATHGAALLAAAERLSPLLVLFPAGGAGLSLGPSLAARLGAAFAGLADLEVADAQEPLPDGVGRVFVRFWAAGRTAYRRLDPVDVERPVVAILPAHGPAGPSGSAEIDVDVISCGPLSATGVETVAWEPDERAPLSLARTLLLVDPALGPAFVAGLRAGLPACVAIADAGQDLASVAAAAPELLICVGDVPAPPIATPRGRVARVLLGDGAPDPRTADVIWRVPSDVAADLVAQQLVEALGSLSREPSP